MLPKLTSFGFAMPPASASTGFASRDGVPGSLAASAAVQAVQAVRNGTREAVATLREVVLMPWDLAPRLPAASEVPDVIVLVHGFFATAGVFRPLRARLARELRAHGSEHPVEVASFTHAPGMSVRRIAQSLGRLVDRIPGRIHLVGHSLGGIVARYYVQELGGDARVCQTISLASPFHGTTLAHPFPVLVGRDLRSDSATLVRLRARASAFAHVPHLSLFGTGDLVVRPYRSAVFPLGDVVELPGLGHNTLLYDQGAQDAVIARLRSHWSDHTPVSELRTRGAHDGSAEGGTSDFAPVIDRTA